MYARYSEIRMIRPITLLLLLTMLIACSPAESPREPASRTIEPTPAPKREAAVVEAVDIVQDDSFPVKVSVVARGHLPNECSSIDQVSQERRGSTFSIVIDSVEYGGEGCPEQRVAFEESFELDVVGLPAGIYVVEVNSLQGTFKLQRDNIQDDGNGVIGGFVWLDRCDLVYPDNGGDPEITAGCIDNGDGSFRGDGVRAEDESGIGGVKVQLGEGVCPSNGLATTLTDADGTFLFSGLTAGDYCLTATNDAERQSLVAVEGIWTMPNDASGQQPVSIAPGDSVLDLAFGWSPVQYPSEQVFFATPAVDCTNKALFVADVTVPDNTPFSPGETFTKTWQLQNLGSCTWDSTYSLAYETGEQMSAPITIPLTITVPPGDFGELSIQFLAPDTPGVYRGEWKLVDPNGESFGIGPGSDRPFWVQIVVSEVDTSS
jgi:Ig-like domain from next to BRCA1 gene/SdrD B-like domain